MSYVSRINGYDLKDATAREDINTLNYKFSDFNLNKISSYDTIQDMKNDNTLLEGQHVRTKGFHTVGDGGDAYYIIRAVTESDTINEMTIISLSDNNLIAELVYSDTLNTRQLGFVADGTTDETEKMNYLKDLFKDNLTVEVNGIILTDPISFESETPILNLTITGNPSTIGFSTFNPLKNGFIINKENDYEKTHAFKFTNFKALNLKYLSIESTESVGDGELPLNGMYGIQLVNSPYSVIDTCSIRKFYLGLYANQTSGILKIRNNNFSLCNIGIWFYNVGDSIIENNYFNAMGWNIYQSDNTTLLDRYSQLNTNGMVHGKAIYMSQGGANSIKGGKIEYCNAGIYIDVSKNIDISDIVFDRCNLYGIAFDSQTYKWTKSNSIVTGCNFIGCGNNTSTNANLDGSQISISRLNNIAIGNCTFKMANQYYQECFAEMSNKFFAPKNGHIKVNFSRKIGISNCIYLDELYTIIPNHSIVNVSNITSNQINAHSNTHGIISTPFGYKKDVLLNSNSNNLTYGYYDLGDKLSKALTSATYISCTGEGSLGTVTSQTCDVLNGTITDGNLTITSSSNYILLKNYNGDEFGECDYIEIAGVSGYKRINNIVYVPSSNKYYAKLNSACSSTVTNATITLHAPTFSS